jgi:hypothetical protein
MLILKRRKTFVKLSIVGDSSNYKNDLSSDVLKTIKENNVKIYHGN